jgi:mRNA interferase MazF
MNLNPGEVWLADLGIAAKMRPVIVVSRHDPNPPRALAICVPVTMQNRGSAYEVELPKLPFLKPGSVANVQGLRAEPTAKLERKLGNLPDEILVKIRQALLFALDLTVDTHLEDSSEPNGVAE